MRAKKQTTAHRRALADAHHAVRLAQVQLEHAQLLLEQRAEELSQAYAALAKVYTPAPLLHTAQTASSGVPRSPAMRGQPA